MTLGQRLPRLLIAGVFAIASTTGFRPIVAQNADSAAQQKADIEPKKRVAKGKPRTKATPKAKPRPRPKPKPQAMPATVLRGT
jgi:hypothetical protein